MVAALSAAFLSVAGLVIGKSVRDTLYLATFPVEVLPYFFLGTGVLTGAAVSAYTRLNAAFSPQRVVPALAGLSAVVLPLLWIGARTGAPWIIAVLYAWTTLSSTFLVSGFWAVYGERFDLREARRLFGVVGVATTAGGVLGGVGSHALLRVMSAEALLLPLAALELLMGAAVYWLAGAPKVSASIAPDAPDAPDDASAPEDELEEAVEKPSAPPVPEPRVGLRSGLRRLAETPYLRNVTLFAVGLTIAGTLCDYALKDAASRALAGKQELAAFFSLFHGAVSAVTLGVQVFVCGPLVARKGLAAALIALPLWLAAGAAMMLVAPVLWAATALRGGENAVRNSFYRAGYELLFVPLAPPDKRLVKPVLDTLIERVADAIGAGVVLLLVTVLGLPVKSLTGVVLGIAVLTLAIVVRVRRGYVETLSTSLVQHALELEEVARAAGDDATTREALRRRLLDTGSDKLRASMRRSSAGVSLMRSLNLELPAALRESLKRPSPGQAGSGTPGTPGPSRAAGAPGASRKGLSTEDPVLGHIRSMLGADPAAARDAMARWDGRDLRLVPFLVRLLAREELHHEAAAALARAEDRVAGTLADHLADPDEIFAIRRRIPRVLAASRGDLAMSALVQGLSDRRFEVRFHCAVALERIQSAGGRRPPPERAWSAIREEVKKSRPMWEAQRLLEEPDANEDPLLTGAVQRRGAHSLRHVFRLLGLVLEDPTALKVSYRAVHGGDAHFRAVGLEYLENILPADVKEALWPLIGDDDEPMPNSQGRSLVEVLADLTASGSSAALPAGVSLKETLLEAPASVPAERTVKEIVADAPLAEALEPLPSLPPSPPLPGGERT